MKLLLAIGLFMMCSTVVAAQGPVNIPLVDTLTCPTCGSTGVGWTFDGVQDITPRAMPAMENYAASQGYPDVSYVNHYVTCPGCETTLMAGTVLGGVVIPMSGQGLANEVQVWTELRSPYPYAAQQYQQQVPANRRQGMFNPGGYSYNQFYMDNYVAGTAPVR